MTESTPRVRSFIGFSALMLGAAAGHAAATGATVEVIDMSAELGTPAGLKTLRLVAHLEDPNALPLSVLSRDHESLLLTTDDPEGFRNSAGILAGTQFDDFPNAPAGDAWDSWVALGGDTLSTSVALFSPGFADNAVPAITGSVVEEDNGGWFIFNPAGYDWDLDNIVLGQFTIGAAYDMFLRADFAYSLDGEILRVPVMMCPGSEFTTVPATGRPDVNGDGAVDFDDLLSVLSQWGGVATSWTPTATDGETLTRYLPGPPTACTIIRRAESHALGAASASVMYDLKDVATTGEFAASIATTGRTTVISLTGEGTYSKSEPYSGSLGSETRFLVEFDVLAPLEVALDVTTCTFGDNIRLTGPNGFEVTCADYTGTLDPGSYLLRGIAYADDFLSVDAFGATLTLSDDGQWADLDDDGVIGFNDVLAVLAAWGE